MAYGCGWNKKTGYGPKKAYGPTFGNMTLPPGFFTMESGRINPSFLTTVIIVGGKYFVS
jgi:hypothetical protein